MISLKDSVRLDGLTPQMALAARIAESCYDRIGVECVVTSANDSTHAGQPVAGDARDPHYCGKALDFRINSVPQNQRQGLVETLQIRLGPTFVVLWEGAGTAGEHVHVQHGHVAQGGQT